MSLTGANADEWVPAKPGTEGVLALAIAHEIVGGGYYRGPHAGEWKSVLKKYTPEYAAAITDVKAGRIHAIAAEFAGARPSLAIGGDSVAGYKNGVSGLVAINILNHLAGNVAGKGSLIPNPDILSSTARNRGAKDGLSVLRADAAASKVKTLLVSGTNPAFTAPGAAKMEEVLKGIPFTASFSSFMDETAALADLVLPAHTSLEDWGDDFAYPSVGYQVATVMQPIVSPVFNTRGVGDIFISLGHAMGSHVGHFSASMPESGFKEYLKASWKDLYKKDKAMNASAVTFGQFWNRLLAEGGWWPGSGPREKTPPAVSPGSLKRHISKASSGFDGDDKEYPFYLMLYPQTGFGDGSGANLPWLQEMPDPMTSVVWGSWIEMNPKTAKGLGIDEGDLVVIESPSGTLKAPAYLHAGIRPDTVSIPVGQGHSQYGRHAEKRGVNPLVLLPLKVESSTGAFALNSTRVKLSRGGRGRMVMMAASTNEHGRGISQTISPQELKGARKAHKVVKH
jgi:anaerobic selenocysteine-containing dehydrogenase